MTYQEAFEKIKALFDNANTSNASGDFAIQIVLTDEDCGGILYAEFRNGVLEIAPYDYQDHDTNVITSLEDFTKIFSSRLSIAKALEKDVLQIEGDPSNVEQLKKMLRKTRTRKTSVKAETKKTAEAKKATTTPKASTKKTAARKTKAAPKAQ